MIFIVVAAQDIEGETIGVAAPVPDGWLDEPDKANVLCFSAMAMFRDHVTKSGAKLALGETISMHLEER